jgi:hypothetical protein
MKRRTTRSRRETRLPVVGDDGAGVPLTIDERRRLDFEVEPVVHARWCKAIAYLFDVDDWSAHYDSTLTVGEHFDVYRTESADTSSVTLRETPDAVLGAGRRD